MGCPILLGFAEKAMEVSNTWQMVANDGDDPTNNVNGMTHTALHTRDPSRGLLERRANLALRVIITDLLRRALVRSEMKDDVSYLDAVPDDLEPVATRAALEQIKDRAIAWNVHHSVEEGKEKSVGELEMVFTERVWQIVGVVDSLMHDMGQGSFITAGLALAVTMAALRVDMPEWMSMFQQLTEVE